MNKRIRVRTITKTNTGLFHITLGDIPGTGEKVQFSGIAIDGVDERKVVEEWG